MFFLWFFQILYYSLSLIVLSFYSSCPLLFNKLAPKLSSLNNNYFLNFPRFCWSEIWIAFWWAILLFCALWTGVTWQLSAGGWSDLEDLRLFHSHACSQGWPKGWDQQRLWGRELTYGVSSMATPGHQNFSRGTSGLQEWLLPQSRRQCMASVTWPQKSHHVTSFAVYWPRQSQGCPDSRRGDIDLLDGRGIKEFAVIFKTASFLWLHAFIFPCNHSQSEISL